MDKEQFKGMLQSFLIKVSRANLPLALDDYSAHLSDLFKEKNQRIAELEEQLKNAIVPKFRYEDYVYAVFSDTDIFKGQIDVFDFYTKRYLVFFGEDIGGEWFNENLLFTTKEEAQAKLKELQGES